MGNEIFTLYQYTHRTDGKRYIGVTNNPARRRNEHTKGRDCARIFSAAIKKYGFEAFDYKILAIFDDVSAAAYHEQATIQTFGTLVPNGYNLTAGAPCTVYGGPFSADARAKISAALIGKIVSDETRVRLSVARKGQHNFIGHTHNAETRAKISAAKMGGTPWNKNKKHPYSAETLKKISAAGKGRKQSIETLAKRSISMKGNKNSLGRKLSPETKAKIGAAGRGSKRSSETRAKISESMKNSMAHKAAMASPETRSKMSTSHRKGIT